MLDASGQVQLSTVAGGSVVDSETVGDSSGDGQVQDKEELIPVVFTWNHGGQNVFLAASFTGWREQIPMVRSGNQFDVVRELPRGVHQYKFIVDDNWRAAPDQPKTGDGQGNTNNVCDISKYERFQVGDLYEKEPPPKLGQHIPDQNDYTLDAPAVPTLLVKSAPCALPAKTPGTGSNLSVPLHSISNHLYIQDAPEDSLCMTVAVTHRYGLKYSTTVYATPRPPLPKAAAPPVDEAECAVPSAPPPAPSASGMNLLKAAVVRPADSSKLLSKKELLTLSIPGHDIT